MSYYPIFLELRSKRCIVVGGGVVAERKVEGLLAAAAAITVVSPACTERLEALAARGEVELVRRPYRQADLDGYDLAFAATGDAAVNETIFRDAQAARVWMNAADDPAHCDFVLPSVLRRGALTLAVASGGSSPALSRMVREQLESYFGEEYGALAEVAAEARTELKGNLTRAAPEAWHDALDETLRRLVREGKRAEAKAHLLKKLGATL